MTAITSAYGHAYQATRLTRHLPAVPRRSSKPDVSIFPTSVPQHAKEAGWCVVARSSDARTDVTFGLAITTEAHLAFAGARTRSRNTAEMIAMIEALSFLGCRGAIARDANSCIYFDSRHAAVFLGTIQARTHVQLAVACQQSMPCVQHRLRFTMQHVYGHVGNLGNECAHHATALGTLDFVSNHNFATCWVRHNFDSSACFDACNNIGEVFEKLRSMRTETASSRQDGSECCVPYRAPYDFHARIASHVVCSQPFFPLAAFYSALLYLK